MLVKSRDSQYLHFKHYPKGLLLCHPSITSLISDTRLSQKCLQSFLLPEGALPGLTPSRTWHVQDMMTWCWVVVVVQLYSNTEYCSYCSCSLSLGWNHRGHRRNPASVDPQCGDIWKRRLRMHENVWKLHQSRIITHECTAIGWDSSSSWPADGSSSSQSAWDPRRRTKQTRRQSSDPDRGKSISWLGDNDPTSRRPINLTAKSQERSNGCQHCQDTKCWDRTTSTWHQGTNDRCWYNTIQYNIIQYNTIQYNTIQYNTIQYNTIQYKTRQDKTRQDNKKTNRCGK